MSKHLDIYLKQKTMTRFSKHTCIYTRCSSKYLISRFGTKFVETTMLEIGFTSPEHMVDFFALLKKSIRSEEKTDLESGSSRPNGMFVIELSYKALAADKL